MNLPASNLYFSSPHPWSAAIRAFSNISFMGLVLQIDDAEDAFNKLRFASAKNQDSTQQLAVAQRIKSVFSRCHVIDATPAFLQTIDRKTLHAATILIRKQFTELSVAQGLEFLKGLLTGSALVDVVLSNSLRLPKMRLTVHARNGHTGHLQVLLTLQLEAGVDSPVVAGKTLHSLLDAAAELLLGVSLEGKINYMNRGMIEIFGGRYFERSNDVSDILDPESSAKLTQITTLISMSNDSWYGYLKLSHPITGETTPVTCRVSVVRDVIDQRVIGYMIAGKRDDLDGDLALMAARKLDSEDQSAKFALVGKVAADVIHDATGAIGVIFKKSESVMEAIQKNPVDDWSASTSELLLREMGTIKLMGRRIQSLVDMVDRLAKDGSIEEKVPTDLDEILREVTDLVEIFAKKLGVTLEIERPQQTILVPIQRLRVSQVLVNLLINACEAVALGKERAVKLSIVCDEEWIYLFVTDSGPTMPPEIKVRLFEPNFTTKKQATRSAVGLCLSKQIARAHGGDLYLDESHEQTRFVLELPLISEVPSNGQEDWEEI